MLMCKAAEETGRRLKVYAVEKNPNAVVTLHVSCFMDANKFYSLEL